MTEVKEKLERKGGTLSLYEKGLERLSTRGVRALEIIEVRKIIQEEIQWTK